MKWTCCTVAVSKYFSAQCSSLRVAPTAYVKWVGLQTLTPNYKAITLNQATCTEIYQRNVTSRPLFLGPFGGGFGFSISSSLHRCSFGFALGIRLHRLADRWHVRPQTNPMPKTKPREEFDEPRNKKGFRLGVVTLSQFFFLGPELGPAFHNDGFHSP